jgi:tetratricopeptide (TPR) repeat protein
MKLCIALAAFGLLLLAPPGTSPLFAAEMKVSIRADFPGGNIVMRENKGNAVQVGPDLRGGEPWFYWHFEAEASQPGRVDFVFPGPFQVGARGPAVSVDDGKTWTWLGNEQVEYAPLDSKDKADRFSHDFAADKLKARFSVGLPYVKANLDAFLAQNATTPYLSRRILTTSRKNRPVDLLQIGKPGPNVTAVLLTARHHACEALASYVLEGFLQEALSESPCATEFRRKYVLYTVPIVDVDGVEEGDQGKGRRPRDHNRDYGQQTHLYPETEAIQKLADGANITLALDCHDPALRGDIHGVVYFDGWSRPHILSNVRELIRWMGEDRPLVMGREVVLLKTPPATPPKEDLPFAIYFAQKKNVVMAATLETPYALDAAMARQYGAALLRAWTRTEFLPEGVVARAAGYETFSAFRKSFEDIYMGAPREAERIAATYLEDPTAPALYKIEANNLMGMMRLRQKNYAAALKHVQMVLDDASATTSQRSLALTQRVRTVGSNPDSAAEEMERSLAAFSAFPYQTADNKALAFAAASTFYERRKDFEKAILYARQQFAVAERHGKGKVLNAIAAIYDKAQQNDKAVETRKEAVALLRKELNPVPDGIQGPVMAADLLDALNGIPTATADEKTEAANVVFSAKWDRWEGEKSCACLWER